MKFLNQISSNQSGLEFLSDSGDLYQILSVLKELESSPMDFQSLNGFYQIKRDLASALRNLEILAESRDITWEVCGWNHSSIAQYLFELDQLNCFQSNLVRKDEQSS